MKKINWCKILGHNWEPVFIKGRYSNIEVKFIGCQCKRCDKGRKELWDAGNKLTASDYRTYSERYFDQ